jgi:16S rRNA (cytidine1402-2'-O)-methyltransferase
MPIPGPSSALAAISIAGDTSATGFFGRRLPAGEGRGSAHGPSRDCAAPRRHQVLFEAPHRIESLAAALAEACPERRLTSAASSPSSSRPSSRCRRAAAGVAGRRREPARGEFVVVLHGSPASERAATPTRRAARALLAALPLKQAVALAGEIGGAPRKLLYARALVPQGRRAPEATARTSAERGAQRVAGPRAVCASCFCW